MVLFDDNNESETTMPVFEVFVKGEPVRFTSAFPTQVEAAAFLRSLPTPGTFATDLLAKPSLSPLQVAWIHKLATDARNRAARPAAPAANLPSMTELVRMLDRAAAAGKRWPRIVVQDVAGRTVAFARTGTMSREPGSVSITDGRAWGQSVYYGSIGRDGVVRPSRRYDEVATIVERVAAEPIRFLAQNGVATGQCCFCARPLSTRESRSVGYGPICAEKFGLPWGDTSLADAASDAAKAVLS